MFRCYSWWIPSDIVFPFLTSEFKTWEGLFLGNVTGQETNYFIIFLILIKRGFLCTWKQVPMIRGKTRRDVMVLSFLQVYTGILFYLTTRFCLSTGRFAWRQAAQICPLFHLVKSRALGTLLKKVTFISIYSQFRYRPGMAQRVPGS